MNLINYIIGAGVFVSIVAIAIFGALGIGWIVDIFKIVHGLNSPITPLFILRCIGIPFFPLGGILGLFV